MYHVVKTIINLPWLGMVGFPCLFYKADWRVQMASFYQHESMIRMSRAWIRGVPGRLGKPGLSASAARATGLPARVRQFNGWFQHWKSCDSTMSNCDLYHPKKLWLKHETCWFNNQNFIKQKRWWEMGHISWESLTKTSYGRGVSETRASLAPPWKRAIWHGYPWLLLAPSQPIARW